MRLNWALKHATSLDNKDIKPIGLEQYINQWGMDLYIPYIATQFCEILAISDQAVAKSKVEALHSVLQSRTSADSSIASTKRYNLWDGVVTTLLMDSKGGPMPKYKTNDKHLRIEYMKINRVVNSASIDKFEIHLSKERYMHIAPLEYYNYTKDYNELN